MDGAGARLEIRVQGLADGLQGGDEGETRFERALRWRDGGPG